MKRTSMLLFAGAAVLMLAGCSKKQTVKSSVKTMTIAAVDPQVPLDMQQHTYSIIMRLTDAVAESLLETTNDGSLKPVLLDSMPTLSADKKLYTFTLKSGIKFQDETPLTSSDVKYSLERLVKQQSMGSLLDHVVGYEDLEQGKTDTLAGVKVISDTQFTIELSDIYTPFLAALSTPYAAIYPAKACEAAGDDWGRKTLIGTGPYKLDSYTSGIGAQMSRFDDYHGTLPKIEKIVYKFIEDPNTQVLEYQKGNVDFVDLNNSLYPVYANSEKLKDQIHSYQMIGGYYFGINVKTISDPKIREAISLAVDRTAICNNILHGTASVPSSMIPGSLVGHDANAQQFLYDPETAKKLIEEAGYPDGYTLRVTVSTKSNLGPSIATAFQQEAKAAGINVDIEQVDSAAWSDMKKSGGMDCCISNWYVDYNDPDSMLYPFADSRTDFTSSFWHNDKFKELMEEGIQTDNTSIRQGLYEKAEHILTREDFAAIPLINETKFYLLNPKITGFSIGAQNRMDFRTADIQ